MLKYKIVQRLSILIYLFLGTQVSVLESYAQNNHQNQEIIGIWKETVLEDKTKKLPMPDFISTIELKENGEAILENIRISQTNVLKFAKGKWTSENNPLNLVHNTEITIDITAKKTKENKGVVKVKLLELENEPTSGIFRLEAWENKEEIEINPPLYLVKSTIPTEMNLEGFVVERLPQQDEFPSSGVSVLGIMTTVLFVMLFFFDIVFSNIRYMSLSQSLVGEDVKSPEKTYHRPNRYKSPTVFLTTAFYTIGWTLIFYIYIHSNKELFLLDHTPALGYLLLLIPIMGIWFLTIINYLTTIDISAKQLQIWSPLHGAQNIEISNILSIAPKKLGIFVRPIRGFQLHYIAENNEEKTLKFSLVGFKNPRSLLKELKETIGSQN